MLISHKQGRECYSSYGTQFKYCRVRYSDEVKHVTQDVFSKLKVIPSVESVVNLCQRLEMGSDINDGVIVETRDSGECYNGASV